MRKTVLFQLAMWLTLLLGCNEKKEVVVNDPSLRDVFGHWLMSREFNDWAYLRKDGAYYGEDQQEWPRFDLDEGGQLGLRSNYELDNDAGNKYEFCMAHRIVWARRVSRKYRDFYVECKSTGIVGETTFHIFGAWEMIYGSPKMKFNFRIFGDKNQYLRFRFIDGEEYFFKRVG